MHTRSAHNIAIKCRNEIDAMINGRECLLNPDGSPKMSNGKPVYGDHVIEGITFFADLDIAYNSFSNIRGNRDLTGTIPKAIYFSTEDCGRPAGVRPAPDDGEAHVFFGPNNFTNINTSYIENNQVYAGGKDLGRPDGAGGWINMYPQQMPYADIYPSEWGTYPNHIDEVFVNVWPGYARCGYAMWFKSNATQKAWLTARDLEDDVEEDFLIPRRLYEFDSNNQGHLTFDSGLMEYAWIKSR
jgi:hypothetical protein